MPNFFPDSKSSILGLSNDVTFVSEFCWKCINANTQEFKEWKIKIWHARLVIKDFQFWVSWIGFRIMVVIKV